MAVNRRVATWILVGVHMLYSLSVEVHVRAQRRVSFVWFSFYNLHSHQNSRLWIRSISTIQVLAVGFLVCSSTCMNDFESAFITIHYSTSLKFPDLLEGKFRYSANRFGLYIYSTILKTQTLFLTVPSYGTRRSSHHI